MRDQKAAIWGDKSEAMRIAQTTSAAFVPERRPPDGGGHSLRRLRPPQAKVNLPLFETSEVS